jgi:ankyrin repeat protein
MTFDISDVPTRLLAALACGDREGALNALRDGDDVNARDHRPVIGDNLTALHYAALNGDATMIRELLSRGAESNARCGTGQTALWFACNGGHCDAIKELLANGADHTITNDDGYTPRDRICASDPETIAMYDAHIASRKR